MSSPKKAAKDALQKIADALSEKGGRGTGTAGNAHLAESARLKANAEALDVGSKRTDWRKGLKGADEKLDSTLSDLSKRGAILRKHHDNSYSDTIWNEWHPDIEGRRRMIEKGLAAGDQRIHGALSEHKATRKGLNDKHLPLEKEHSTLSSQSDLARRTGEQTNEEQVRNLLSNLRRPKPLGSETADRLLSEGADHARHQQRKESTIAASTILGAGAAGAAGAVYQSSWTKKKQSDQNGQK